MFPGDLKAEKFSAYPPEARKAAVANLPALQRLPLSFLPSLLRELIDYDYKFPAERKSLDRELQNVNSLTPQQMQDWFHSFAQIHLSPELENMDWANAPAQFVERLSAHLWTTHQLDAFRTAATEYAERMRKVTPPEEPLAPRLGITVIGQGVAEYSEPLFRKLRPHGAYFNRVNPENGLQQLLEFVGTRAQAHPAAYGHWYIDGGVPAHHISLLTRVSYAELAPARAALLRKMRSQIERPGMGPEELRTMLAQMHPADLSMGKSADAVLDRFQIKLLTEGSGTQIFSTTFAQWATRETLRRAQPLTILTRFAPRQRQKPMNELLAASTDVNVELDPVGSLVDADMGAYYNWLNLQRLPGAEQSSFVVWFEDHNEAVAIGPAIPRATTSNAAVDMRKLLAQLS
jgi:hypothetical protein